MVFDSETHFRNPDRFTQEDTRVFGVMQHISEHDHVKLPFGKGQAFGSTWGSVADAVLGGWRFSPIFIMRTGTPVNVVLGTNPNGTTPGLRPDVTRNPNMSRGERNVLEYFDTKAFTTPAGALGDAGRNIVVGPGYVNLDASLAKEFTIESRWKLQLRAEAFNVSNTVHWANPDGNFNSGTFGQVNSVMKGSNRLAQLAAKLNF